MRGNTYFETTARLGTRGKPERERYYRRVREAVIVTDRKEFLLWLSCGHCVWREAVQSKAKCEQCRRARRPA